MNDLRALVPAARQALHVPGRHQPGRRCAVQSCQRRHYARGWCSLHWQQARAGKDPHAESRLPAGVERPAFPWVEPPAPVDVPKGWT